MGTLAFCIWNAHRAKASVLSLPANPRNLTFESRLLKFCLLTSTALYTELLFRIRHTAKFYYSPEILPVNIGHLLFNSILQNRKVQKKKCLWKNLRNNCSLNQSAFMYSKYHQIPGCWPEIFRSSQYWSYYSTESCKIGKFKKKKKCFWENLRNNCSLHKSAFMHSKYHQFLVFGRKYFAPVNIGHIIQLNLAKSES